MRRCILHIGMHKTGSSSIQESLKSLSSKDFRYARLLRTPNHSGAIINAFSEASRHQRSNSTHPVHGHLDLSNRIRTRFSKQLERAKTDTLIVSGEGITKLSLEELNSLKKFISRYVPEVVVACYVRSPKSFMESAIQQRIKAGLNAFDFDACYPAYRDRFEKFDYVFEPKNVHFWAFKPKALKDNCVVTDFCAHFGLNIPPENIVRVNESLSLDALSLLYSYHKHTLNSSGLIKLDPASYTLLLRQLAQLSGAKLKLSSDLVSTVLHKNDKDINWMESRLGNSLQEKEKFSEIEITSESDLLCPGDTAILWLSKQLNIDSEVFKSTERTLAVSRYMHALRENISSSALSQSKSNVTTFSEESYANVHTN